jgi:hypothetical protein
MCKYFFTVTLVFKMKINPVFIEKLEFSVNFIHIFSFDILI